MKAAVVSFGKGAWYPRGAERLALSLRDTGFMDWGEAHLYTDEGEILSPLHQVAPYAFKPNALEQVRLVHGADIVLWCDSSVWAVGDLQTTFRHIEDHGHLFFHNTCTGEWSSDAALQFFHVTRDAAMRIPMLHGLCLGLDLRWERSREFLDAWLQSVPTFPGSWTNEGGQVSRDPRVRGHRHDQTAASIIAWQLGMSFVSGPETFLWHPTSPMGPGERDPKAPPNVRLYAQGM